MMQQRVKRKRRIDYKALISTLKMNAIAKQIRKCEPKKKRATQCAHGPTVDTAEQETYPAQRTESKHYLIAKHKQRLVPQ